MNKTVKIKKELLAGLEDGSIDVNSLSHGELEILGYKRDKNNAIRNERGHYVKGSSGNMKGRGTARQELQKISEVDTEEYRKDAKKALEYLLETAKTRAEVAKISKELLPYQTPKLASVESVSTEQTKIIIEWIQDEPPVKKVKGKETKVIEGGNSNGEPNNSEKRS